MTARKKYFISFVYLSSLQVPLRYNSLNSTTSLLLDKIIFEVPTFSMHLFRTDVCNVLHVQEVALIRLPLSIGADPVLISVLPGLYRA